MKNYMEYKNYIGSVNYSDEDECFYGKVEGLIKALITFEGKSVDKLKKDFIEAVDFYLENCKKNNEKPEVQCKGSFNVRVGSELHAKAKIKAEKEKISINELVKLALSQYLETA